jgi:hypothetical protein
MQLNKLAMVVDARGLAASEAIFGDLREHTFVGVLETAFRGSGNLTPGEEVAIECDVPNLPRNADVKEILATIRVTRSAATAPEPTSVAVVTGTGSEASTQSFGISVSPSGLPSNVQVRLDQGDPIWTHSGTLEEGPHEIPNFAVQANAYLDQVKLAPDAQTTLRFMVKSDTAGSVEIEVEATPAYSLLQTQTWPNPLDGSVNIDRNLDVDFGAVTRIDLDPLAQRTGSMARHGVALDVSGTLGPERMLGSLALHDGTQWATISGDYFVAQAFRLDDPDAGLGFAPGTTLTVVGVTAVVEVDAESELYVEVQPDAGGGAGPASGPPLAKLDLTLEQPQDGAPRLRAFAAFESPAELSVDVDYWIVFKGIRGITRLGLAPVTGGYLGGMRVNRGGQLWRPLEGRGAPVTNGSHLAAVARLVYLPTPDIRTAALEIGVLGTSSTELAEPEASARRVALVAPGDLGPTSLVLSSHARGSLTVANVVQEFAVIEQGVRRR